MSTSPSPAIVLSALLCCALTFTGCGLKGPLYLPDKASNIETRTPARKRSDDGSDVQKPPAAPDPAAAPAAGNAAATPAGQVSGSPVSR